MEQYKTAAVKARNKSIAIFTFGALIIAGLAYGIQMSRMKK
jgi:hypothetical protein